MRVALWAVFFVITNLMGIEAFKAAMTLPRDEAFLPGLLTLPMVGLAAFGVTRVVGAWQSRDE